MSWKQGKHLRKRDNYPCLQCGCKPINISQARATVFTTYLPEKGEKPTKCCLINAFIPALSHSKFIPEEVKQDISMCSGHFQKHSLGNMQIIFAEVHSLQERRLLFGISQKTVKSLLRSMKCFLTSLTE